jgi:hypothetical protein
MPGLSNRFVTEADLQRTVTDALKLQGFLTYHTFDSRRSAEGFPDVVAIHPGRGVGWALELKGPRGKPTDEQWTWIDAFAKAGFFARVLWPVDLNVWLDELKASVSPGR